VQELGAQGCGQVRRDHAGARDDSTAVLLQWTIATMLRPHTPVFGICQPNEKISPKRQLFEDLLFRFLRIPAIAFRYGYFYLGLHLHATSPHLLYASLPIGAPAYAQHAEPSVARGRGYKRRSSSVSQQLRSSGAEGVTSINPWDYLPAAKHRFEPGAK
jgi:hypothetical protein